MRCPDCGTPAQMTLTNLLSCQVTEALFSAGKPVYLHQGQEILEVVALICKNGHHYRGPVEMLHAQREDEVPQRAVP
ncbi:MAG: hypothetical protein NVSMB32_18550 [Actinomycetota bacterium]